MKTITKEELMYEAYEFAKEIDRGFLFIHPTDTIYGIGCDATNDEAIKKLRKVKQMAEKPISVIAPSIQWIDENCVINDKVKEWLDKLPGPYTLILKLKNNNCVSELIHPEGDSLGIRIPDHWFTRFVSEYGKPICTTSANVTGKTYMTTEEDIDPDIRKGIHFCIYEGEKKGKASNIVHLEGEETKIRER